MGSIQRREFQDEVAAEFVGGCEDGRACSTSKFFAHGQAPLGRRGADAIVDFRHKHHHDKTPPVPTES